MKKIHLHILTAVSILTMWLLPAVGSTYESAMSEFVAMQSDWTKFLWLSDDLKENQIVLYDFAIDDGVTNGVGNQNRLINPGETISFSPRLLNSSEETPATNVTATLTTESPHIAIIQPTAEWPIIQSTSAENPLAPYALQISSNAPTDMAIDFELHISSEHGSWTEPITCWVREETSATLRYITNAIYDWTSEPTPGNKNNQINAGENIGVDLYVANIGEMNATSVTGILTSASSYVTLDNDTYSYDQIYPGYMTPQAEIWALGAYFFNTEFHFSVASNTPPGEVLGFQLTLTSDQGSWSHPISYTVKESPAPPEIIFEDGWFQEYSGDYRTNEDGQVSQGEHIRLYLSLTNITATPVHYVQTLLSSTNPYVDITYQSSSSTAFPSEEDFGFNVRIAPHCPPGEVVLFKLDITSDQGVWSEHISLTVAEMIHGLDLTIFDETTGDWYILYNGGGDDTANWGWEGVEPVPGDYDGDGKSDLAIFDQNTGRWFIRKVDGTILAWEDFWGWPGVRPVSGDYDGDGKDDLAVFDQNTGHWYIKTVSGDILVWEQFWGWPGVEPVSGDFNGDGSNDLAIFDHNSGRWYIRTLEGTILAWEEFWGWPGVQPLSGDYNADGLDDLAVFDLHTGLWFVKEVQGSILEWEKLWGFEGCRPVPGDYDKDGHHDFVVYEEKDGHWFFNIPGSGVSDLEFWGGSDFIPVVGDYDGL